MTVRLIKRDWNSVLQASDFTQGTAKYVTQEIDRTLEERHVTSTGAAQTLNFAASEAGVYVVEVTATDRLGRRQTLRVDCFMAGDTPVTWSRPPAKTVTVKTDKDDYAPGENATLLIESPFQAARALVVTEQPDGAFDYAWVDVADGVGRYTLAVRQGPDAARAGACAADARASGGAAALGDRTVRPGQADDAGGDHLGQGAAGAEQGERGVRGSGDGAAGADRRGDAAADR